MSRIPGLGGALGDFQVSIPPELYLLIAEELGQHIMQEHIETAVLENTGDDVPDDEVDPQIQDVTRYLGASFPTLHMLTAGMVNKFFREKILGTALRWDAVSENPFAIFFAASENHTDLLEHALKQPHAKPDYVPKGRNWRKETPLMAAARRGHLEAVELLLKSGADVDRIDGFEMTWYPSPFVISDTMMLDSGMDVNQLRLTSLHCGILAAENAIEISKLILHRLSPQFNQTIAEETERFLALVVARDLVELVGPLIERGAQLDQGGQTTHFVSTPVIHHATSPEMIRKLVDAGADVQTPREVGLNALHTLCLRHVGYPQAIRELVRRGVDVNEPTAGGYQRSELLERQDMAALVDRAPQTALNLACRHLNLPNIRMLLELGANAMGTDHDVNSYQDRDNGEFYQSSPFHDLFLPEHLAGSPLARDGQALSKAILGSMECLVNHGGARALGLRHNIPVGYWTDHFAKLDREMWSHIDIADNNSTYTPLELFFMQPLVDDDRIPEAMWSACDSIAEQINNRITPFSITPLIALLSHRFDHTSAENQFYRPKLVEWLLQHGADPNMTDMEGFTPLHYAVFWLDVDAVRLLLAYGAKTQVQGMVTALTALEVAFGAVYSNKQVMDQHDWKNTASAWKTMVDLLDSNGIEPFGMSSCTRRWTPGHALPACALPNFYDGYCINRGDTLHPELQNEDLASILLANADEKRAQIIELLIGKTHLRAPRIVPHSLGSATDISVAPTILDWACATGQNHTFIERLVNANAKMGETCPRPMLRHMDDTTMASNWRQWRAYFAENWPQALPDWRS